MLVGYMRVSKADGSQTVALQRDALLAAGVDGAQLYEDHASGRTDDRPGAHLLFEGAAEGRSAGGVETGPARPEPAPPGQHR